MIIKTFCTIKTIFILFSAHLWVYSYFCVIPSVIVRCSLSVGWTLLSVFLNDGISFISTSLETSITGIEKMLNTLLWNWFEMNHFPKHDLLPFSVSYHSVLYCFWPTFQQNPSTFICPSTSPFGSASWNPVVFYPRFLVSFQPWVNFGLFLYLPWDVK